jgi:hypothetical protein
MKPVKTVRVLCDEHIEPPTTEELSGRDIPATHVTDRPGSGASVEEVAAHARQTGAVLLTNDDDFLDPSQFSDVTVFHYPENHLAAHRLAERVESAVGSVSTPTELPNRLFLTVTYEGQGKRRYRAW